MATNASSYPVNLQIDYPDRPLNRLTTFFRIFTAVPIGIILSLVSGSGQYSSGGILFLPVLLMILFRQKYPMWWFNWNFELAKFSTRVSAYLGLLTDVYPSTDEEQYAHLEIPYPDVPRDLNRWLPLIKWFLAIPHYVVVAVLGLVAVILIIVAWFAILFTGRYPRGIFDFVVGVYRWALRVEAYAFILITDRYPPFSLT